VLIGLGFVGMGLNHAIWGFAFYFAICLGRGLNGPILNPLQQRLIPSRDRASLLSINSMVFRLAFFALGPVLGIGVDRYGEHLVLLTAAAVALPLCVVALLWLRRTLRAGSPPAPATFADTATPS
jgi:predicted MFS family arabinose efflux permease